MIKNKLYVITLLLTLLIACGGGKKQTLEAEKVEEEVFVAARDSLQRSAVVYNAAEEIKLGKVYKLQIGKKIVGTNLVKLNLAQNSPEEKEIKLDEFYKKVSYIKLKHPLSDSNIGFLGDSDIKQYTVRENGESVSTRGGFNSQVYLAGNNIVAGDNYFGYHVYSKDGTFLYTLASREELPQYDNTSNTVSYYTNIAKGIITNFSVFADKALISVREDSVFRTHIYDINKQKGTMAFKNMAPAFLVNDKSFLFYNSSTNIKKQDYYMRIVSYLEEESTLIQTYFTSYNSEATTKGRRSSPERHTFTYYNSVLTTRQAYNDTIYRIKDNNTLEAAYVLNSGKLKLSNKDAHSENKENKLIINNWLETDDFMFIMTFIDQDFPNNRKENKVKFRYYYYNKKEGKLYMKEGRSIYPEEYTFSSTIDGAIPLLAATAKQYGKKLYTSYTKSQLKNMIDKKDFNNFPPEQQVKLQSLHDDLSDGELLIAVFE